MDGPAYQKVIRGIFCVLYWNGSLISSSFIMLSMRSIGITYLRKPDSTTYAGSLIRRIVRMTILLSAASGLATAIFSQIHSDQYIDEFNKLLPNTSITAPVQPHGPLAVLNSLFDLFWLTTDFSKQAANAFWPTATLWVPAVSYYEGFTVYVIMVVVPFTRPAWHLQVLALFALGSFWYESWGWYAATGLLLADVAANSRLNELIHRGIPIRDEVHLPAWAISAFMGAAGLGMKYTLVSLPQYTNAEIVVHPFVDLSEQTNKEQFIDMGPYPRLDDWLVITAVLLVIETVAGARHVLAAKPLAWLGERAFALFFAQSIIFWSAGIKLWLYIHNKADFSTAAANVVVLAACVPAVLVLAELFYRLIDVPSQWLARRAYIWLIN
ncbi:hypothetical protein EJ03DRAFT_354231 [Teratosphaeria nubilosa]|uniref:Acyltransferase 3 domain-containing protein n=1 Tax=Teratosphaeria nubilosa TaxID=161662 RepID=A0A6G1L104_9PEZI|nr:hypothetical protein EJ03DRAFT_354231 [Teratosphaeria nubilosa]